MCVYINACDAMPVVADPRDFDAHSGNRLERLVFNPRGLMVVICIVLTIVLGAFAVSKLALRPSFEKMIPQSQPYIRNLLDNRDQLPGMGTSVRVVGETTKGEICDPKDERSEENTHE